MSFSIGIFAFAILAFGAIAGCLLLYGLYLGVASVVRSITSDSNPPSQQPYYASSFHSAPIPAANELHPPRSLYSLLYWAVGTGLGLIWINLAAAMAIEVLGSEHLPYAKLWQHTWFAFPFSFSQTELLGFLFNGQAWMTLLLFGIILLSWVPFWWHHSPQRGFHKKVKALEGTISYRHRFSLFWFAAGLLVIVGCIGAAISVNAFSPLLSNPDWSLQTRMQPQHYPFTGEASLQDVDNLLYLHPQNNNVEFDIQQVNDGNPNAILKVHYTSTDENDNQLTFSYKNKNLTYNNFNGKISIHKIEAYIPAGLSVDLKASSKSTRVHDIFTLKRLTVTSISGDIQLDHLSSVHTIKLQSSKGSCSVNHSHTCQSLNINSTIGSIDVSGLICVDKMKLKTVRGNISIEEVEVPDLLMQTTSGRLRTNDSTAAQAYFKAISGNIILEDSRFPDAYARTKTGTIQFIGDTPQAGFRQR